MTVINKGRFNNAMRALAALHAQTFDTDVINHFERLWYEKVARYILGQDDEYLVKQSSVPDRSLRMHHAKALEKIASLGQEIERLNREHTLEWEATQTAKRKATEEAVKAQELQAEAVGWKRAADGYVVENRALRAQLEAAGIDIDPRFR